MKITFILLIVSGLAACAGDNQGSFPLTYQAFETHLHASMDYPAIVRNFGEPAKDIGSGIHIYVYELPDGTEIWIGYADEIKYALHLGKNRQLLHTIL